MLLSAEAVFASPKIISLKTRRTSHTSYVSNVRVNNTDEVPLKNFHTGYSTDVTVGTPPQAFQLHVDTSSSDTWVWDQSAVAANPYCVGGGCMKLLRLTCPSIVLIKPSSRYSKVKHLYFCRQGYFRH